MRRYAVGDGNNAGCSAEKVAVFRTQYGPNQNGRVTSSKWSPTLGKAIGLAWLPAVDAVDDRSITVRLGTGREGSTASAVVRTSPFYDPAGERVRS